MLFQIPRIVFFSFNKPCKTFNFMTLMSPRNVLIANHDVTMLATHFICTLLAICGMLGHYKSKCRYYFATKDGQNEAKYQRKYVAGGYTKSKNLRDWNVAHLSCGTSEILNKAGESGMFVDVKIRDNVLE